MILGKWGMFLLGCWGIYDLLGLVRDWCWLWISVEGLITDHRLNCFSATVEETMNEYKACESPDYISYVSRSQPV